MGYEHVRCLGFEYISALTYFFRGQDVNMAVGLFSLCDSLIPRSLFYFSVPHFHFSKVKG